MTDELTDEEKQLPNEMIKLLNDFSSPNKTVSSEAEQKLAKILISKPSQHMDQAGI